MKRTGKKSSAPERPKNRKLPSSKAKAGDTPGIARRRVLKGVIAGGGVVATAMSLPTEWSKPVVRSIVASAHAQVSPPTGSPTAPTFPPFTPISGPLFPLVSPQLVGPLFPSF